MRVEFEIRQRKCADEVLDQLVTVVSEPSLRDNSDIRFQSVERASFVQRGRIVHWPISIWAVGDPLKNTPARLTSWCHYETLNTTRSKTPLSRWVVLIDWLAPPVRDIWFCIARLVVKDGFQDSVEVPIAAVVVEVTDPIALL
jgi:hypothetical protein